MENSILYTEKGKNAFMLSFINLFSKHPALKWALVWTVLPVLSVAAVALATGALVLPIALVCGWV